ncbi:MAG: DUF3450 family protein [Planctomycetes bacterium]|nr:DUF3450 family protein [Planctomycetota bacterium]
MTPSAPSGWRSLIACFVMSSLFAALPAQESGQVGAARTTLEKWVEVRGLLSKERRDWDLAKETLKDRIDVQRREIASLRQRIADAEKNIGAADTKFGELAGELERRKTTETKLSEHIVALEKRVLDLLPRLPEPLREKIRPVSQLIPERAEDAKLRLDERFRNVLFVCKQVHQWNREVTVRSEVRPLPDGTSVEVTVVYLGIGQAFYSGSKGRLAGVGVPGANGWSWTPANELAPEVALVVAMLAGEKVAAYVRLPVQIL